MVTYDTRWRVKMAVNGLGAIASAIVMLVFAVTKFRDGAWIILVLIPLLVGMFLVIHRHYKDLAARLSLEDFQTPPLVSRQRVIMPISGVHRGTLTALRYARTLSKDITVLHVSVDAQRQPNEIITVVVPEFVPRHRWQHLLHTQAAIMLRLALRSKPGIIVMDVPYQLDR